MENNVLLKYCQRDVKRYSQVLIKMWMGNIMKCLTPFSHANIVEQWVMRGRA